MELFSEIPLRFLSRFVSLLWVWRRAAEARHIFGPFILPLAVPPLQSIEWKFTMHDLDGRHLVASLVSWLERRVSLDQHVYQPFITISFVLHFYKGMSTMPDV